MYFDRLFLTTVVLTLLGTHDVRLCAEAYNAGQFLFTRSGMVACTLTGSLGICTQLP